jgi:hypothetical protein
MTTIKWPFSAIVSGPSMCGKTVFIKNLLKNWNRIVDTDFDRVIWFFSESNSLPSIDDLDVPQKINFQCGIPQTFSFDQHEGEKVFYILDDLILDIEKSKNICELFIKAIHHKSISALLVLQNFFIKGNFMRTISLNCKYLIIFKNPRAVDQFNFLARQICPHNSKGLVTVYKRATLKPYTYLFIDLAADTNEAFRFRTDLFNDEFSTYFCPTNLLTEENGFCSEIVKGEQAYFVRT